MFNTWQTTTRKIGLPKVFKDTRRVLQLEMNTSHGRVCAHFNGNHGKNYKVQGSGYADKKKRCFCRRLRITSAGKTVPPTVSNRDKSARGLDEGTDGLQIWSGAKTTARRRANVCVCVWLLVHRITSCKKKKKETKKAFA